MFRKPFSPGPGLLAAGALLLAACGSNSVILKRDQLAPAGTRYAIRDITMEIPANQEKPPEHFLVAVKSFLKADLAAANATGEGDPAAWQIDVKVVAYRMRSGFSRFMFGMLAGKDGIDSQVQVVDASGRVSSQSTVSTFNATAMGGSEDVAKMHADEIAKVVLGVGTATRPAPAASAADAVSQRDPRLPKPRHNPGDVSDDSGKPQFASDTTATEPASEAQPSSEPKKKVKQKTKGGMGGTFGESNPGWWPSEQEVEQQQAQ